MLAHFFNASTASALTELYPSAAFKCVRQGTAKEVNVILAWGQCCYRSETARASTLLRDFMFASASRAAARAVSSHGVPTYLYRFNVSLAASNRLFDVIGAHGPFANQWSDRALTHWDRAAQATATRARSPLSLPTTSTTNGRRPRRRFPTPC